MVVLAHYSELALKGHNRMWFLRRLLRNLHIALAGLGVQRIRSLMGRIEIVLDDAAAHEEIAQRLGRVFGLANFSIAHPLPLDIEAMAATIVEGLPKDDVSGFKVRVRRADKTFPLRSPDLEAELGARVVDARGWTVDLHQPALTIGVEIVPGEAFYHLEKTRGPGGLPTGTAGRVVSLLSGGIDSPVAAWRLMRRGCQVTFVHFHSVPFLSRVSQDKARRLAEVLTRYQLRSALYLVPFGELQRQITVSVPGDLRVVVYRRFMLRIAEQLARQTRSRALVTGEVLGQVASQTLDNMAVIDRAVELPVFRPLIGMDKEEVILQAQRIGTFEISTLPDEDCCTLFTPRHPETHARHYQVDDLEQGLAIAGLVDEALARVCVERFSYPVLRSTVGPSL
ncbi:MAG: tRNA uracil 4-sulfurtransferase ThiI [Vicinamibacterales bacterium]